MTDMEILKIQRSNARRQLTLKLNELKTELEKEPISVNSLNLLLDQLKGREERFKEAEMGVLGLLKEEHESFKAYDEMELYNDKIVEIRHMVNEKLNSEMNQTPLIGNFGADSRAVTAYEDLSDAASTVRRRKNHIRKPKIDLRKFDGSDVTEWSEFWDSFVSAIEEDEDLTDQEKLHYLKSSLEGEALKTVKGMKTTDANYAVAKELLIDRYGSDEVIADQHVAELMKLRPVREGNTSDLRALYEALTFHVRALDNLGKSADSLVTFLKPFVLTLLPDEMNDTWNKGPGKTKDVSLETLLKFVKEEVKSKEKTQCTKKILSQAQDNQKRTSELHITKKKPTGAALTATASREPKEARSACGFCLKDCNPVTCQEGLRLSTEQRAEMLKKNGACFRCLRKGHMGRFCKEKIVCTICNGKHNTLLHKTPKVTTMAASNSCEEDVFFRTALADLEYSDGCVQRVRILFDSGANRAWIRTKLTKGLEVVKTEPMRVGGFGKTSNYSRSRITYKLKLYDTHGGMKEAIELNATGINEIIEPIESSKLSMTFKSNPFKQVGYPNAPELNLENLPLADDLEDASDLEIDILIGLKGEWKIFSGVTLKSEVMDSPRLLESKFGWVLSGDGCAPSKKKCSPKTLLTISNQNLNEELRTFWELENLGIPSTEEKQVQEEEILAMEFFEKSVSYKEDHYEVGLPILPENRNLNNNRGMAIRRLEQQEKRMAKDPRLKEAYDGAMDSYLKNGFAEEAPCEVEEGTVRYLPHHMVVRPDKETTKFRLCFDTSAKQLGERSLNDVVLPGPNPIPNLHELLVRFRKHQIVICGDVEKMFLKVGIKEEDRNYLSYVYRKEGQIVDYRMKVACFGVNAFPFICTSVVKHHLEKYKEIFPTTVEKLKEDIFVDDLLTGCDYENEAKQLFKQSSEIMSTANFFLRKWKTNSFELRRFIEEDIGSDRETNEENLELESMNDCANTPRILGAVWNPKTDCLKFTSSYQEQDGNEKDTKRSVASAAFKLFDPLGFLSPFTVRSKILIQKLWLCGIDWDEPLPEELEVEWKSWLSELKELELISIPRKIVPLPDGIQEFQLHVFGDASEAAYGTVAYLRVSYLDGSHHVSFLTAKSRVAPTKKVQLPRLELMAGLISARLAKNLMNELKFEPSKTKIVCWTDSTVALCWIKGAPNRWKQFVANRVVEIQEITEPSCWRHCPGKDNPADKNSRGMRLDKLKTDENWWNGPRWLSKDESYWPRKENFGTDRELEVEREARCLTAVSSKEERTIDVQKFSSYSKLLRFVVKVFRWKNLWCKKESNVDSLEVEEFNNAKEFLVKQEQRIAFHEDIERLKEGRELSSDSKLKNFTPFLDDKGILRVGGRIEEADVLYETKHPILLPHSHFAMLIARYYHVMKLHTGVIGTLSALREEFWILRGRQLSKDLVKKCVTCRRVISQPFKQRMAPLPIDRLRRAFPFEKVGLDFAGPLFVSGNNGELEKGYICIFTCTVVRAIHLELCTSMDTESFWMALKRFIATRGRCAIICSDNARTFKRANKELRGLWKEFQKLQESEEFKTYLGLQKIHWKFIVERAPWWGGMYERLVRSVKIPLRKTLGKSSLNWEQLNTALKEVEAMINSRPLTYLMDDPNEPEVITPAHFLIGRSMDGLPEEQTIAHEEVSESSYAKISRMLKHRQQLLDRLWVRWTKEYVVELNSMKKWQKTAKEIEVGDVVLVMDENKPRLSWKTGIVDVVYTGRDGHIRAAEVRTSSGNLRRAIQRLCPLEINANAQNLVPQLDENGCDPQEQNSVVTENPEEFADQEDPRRSEGITVPHGGEDVLDRTRSGRLVKRPSRFII